LNRRHLPTDAPTICFSVPPDLPQLRIVSEDVNQRNAENYKGELMHGHVGMLVQALCPLLYLETLKNSCHLFSRYVAVGFNL
jgi:hypothetical protein